MWAESESPSAVVKWESASESQYRSAEASGCRSAVASAGLVIVAALAIGTWFYGQGAFEQAFIKAEQQALIDHFDRSVVPLDCAHRSLLAQKHLSHGEVS